MVRAEAVCVQQVGHPLPRGGAQRGLYVGGHLLQQATVVGQGGHLHGKRIVIPRVQVQLAARTVHQTHKAVLAVVPREARRTRCTGHWVADAFSIIATKSQAGALESTLGL